jgi:hypothetical protein
MLKNSILLLMVAGVFAFQSPTTPAGGSAGSVADALATGWMLGIRTATGLPTR